MKKYIIIALLFISLGVSTPVKAQVPVFTQAQIQAMSPTEKKAIIIKLMTLLIDLMKQLQVLQNNQKNMTEDIKVGSANGSINTDATADFQINRFVVRDKGVVLVESLVELDIQATQFIVDNEVLPVKIDGSLAEKQGNYFVYNLIVTPNLYEVSKQKEGENQQGPAFARFTVKVVSQDGRSLISKEALQVKNNFYEVAVEF